MRKKKNTKIIQFNVWANYIVSTAFMHDAGLWHRGRSRWTQLDDSSNLDLSFPKGILGGKKLYVTVMVLTESFNVSFLSFQKSGEF